MPASADLLKRVGDLLRQADFDEAGVGQVLGLAEGAYLATADTSLNLLRISGQGRLADLVKLLVLGVALPDAQAAAALAPLALDELAAAGLLSVQHGNARASLRVEPRQGLLIASDPPPLDQPDLVTGVNPVAMSLSHLTVRRPVARALDLGTGCGIQACLAAQHAGHVIGIDVNPRALEFARIGAALSGLENVELRHGSWFEPVGGHTFDLIVANPPFVISPEAAFVYRDSGLDSDDLSRLVVSQTPAFLAEGGFASIVCNWVESDASAWWRRPASWTDGQGCDTILLRFFTEDVLTYASRWNWHLQHSRPDTFAEVMERWLAYYRRSGVEAITTGAVIVRRRADRLNLNVSSNWVAAFEASPGPDGPAGDHVAGLFAAQDTLRSLADDRALLAYAVHPVEGVALEQRIIYAGGSYQAEPSMLRRAPGLNVYGQVEPQFSPVLLRCDGQTPLSQIVTETAEDLGVEQAAWAAAVTRLVRQLVELGLLHIGPTTY